MVVVVVLEVVVLELEEETGVVDGVDELEEESREVSLRSAGCAEAMELTTTSDEIATNRVATMLSAFFT